MGSTSVYSNLSYKDFLDSEFRGWNNEELGIQVTPIKKVLKGNIGWIAFERRNNGSLEYRFIMLIKFQRDKGMIIYKNIDETMGPYELDVPPSIWKCVDGYPFPPGQYVQEWRAKVEAHLSQVKDKVKLSAGDKVKVSGYGLDDFVFTLIDLKAHILMDETGQKRKFKGLKKEYLKKVD